jgi:hypothetical protein
MRYQAFAYGVISIIHQIAERSGLIAGIFSEDFPPCGERKYIKNLGAPRM